MWSSIEASVHYMPQEIELKVHFTEQCIGSIAAANPGLRQRMKFQDEQKGGKSLVGGRHEQGNKKLLVSDKHHLKGLTKQKEHRQSALVSGLCKQGDKSGHR